MTPLYKLAQNQSPETSWEELINSTTAHPGLIFDKFPNGWTHTQNSIKLPDGEGGAKEKWYIDAATRKQDHLTSNLEQAIKRQKNLTESLSGTTLALKTDWRFITGLGNSHPYETGFTWHRTLGVPYLTGSSIKGILRDWITNWTDQQENEAKKEANRLLGSDDTDNPHVGSVIIFDALPTIPPKLEVDILNPHYQQYYTDPTNPPADYYNPVPIKFLTIAAGQSFLFSLSARTQTTEATNDINQCAKYLCEALNTIGAGGKTAVGYGIFSESLEASRLREAKEEKQKEQVEKKGLEKEAESAAKESGLPKTLTPMIIQLEQEKWQINNAKFYAGVEQWLPHIQQEDKTTQQTVAQILGEILEKLSPKNKGILKNPDKKQGKKQNSAYKPQAVKIAKQLLKLSD